MYVRDIFKIPEWEIKELLMLVITLQILFLSLKLAETNGMIIPLFTEIISLFLILFIPGILFIRILKLKNIESNTEIFIYAVGLSITILMFLGFTINLIYPYIGVKPFTLTPVIVTVNILIYILCVSVYFHEKNDPISSTRSNSVDLKSSLSPPLIFLTLVPFLSIIGTYLMNYYDTNIILMILIVLIASIVFLIGSNRFIPENLYPLAVFIISISLILHRALISTYIWGWDVSLEYFIVNQILGNGVWMMGVANNYNSMLSVVILAPMISIFTGLKLVWVLKIIYPFIFSLLPLGLYYIFKRQTNPRIAFLSVFLVVLMFTFYTEMLTILRQEIAELFLVLLVLLLVSNDMNKIKRGILAVLFGFSIVVSHYGIAYIMLFGFSFLMLTDAFMRINPLVNLYNFISNKFQDFYITTVGHFNFLMPFNMELCNVNVNEDVTPLSKRIESYRNRISGRLEMENRLFTLFFVAFFAVFLFTWYMYTSNGSAFSTFIDIGNSIASNISDIMNSNTSQGLNIVLTQQVSLLRTVHKDIYLISQFFIMIGVILLLLGIDKMNFQRDYKRFSLFAFVLLVSGLLVPYLASQMNTTRLYHVALLFLAPMVIIGMYRSANIIFKLMRFRIKSKTIFQAISIFLIVFLIFDTGFVYQIVGGGDTISMSLSDKVDFPKLNQMEIGSAKWLQKHYDYDYHVYSDAPRSAILVSFFSANKEIPPYNDLIENKSYIYFGTLNIVSKSVLISKMTGANNLVQAYSDPAEIVKGRPVIFDNGGSKVYADVP